MISLYLKIPPKFQLKFLIFQYGLYCIFSLLRPQRLVVYSDILAIAKTTKKTDFNEIVFDLTDWLHAQFWICRTSRDFYQSIDDETEGKIWHKFTLLFAVQFAFFYDLNKALRRL